MGSRHSQVTLASHDRSTWALEAFCDRIPLGFSQASQIELLFTLSNPSSISTETLYNIPALQ